MLMNQGSTSSKQSADKPTSFMESPSLFQQSSDLLFGGGAGTMDGLFLESEIALPSNTNNATGKIPGFIGKSHSQLDWRNYIEE